MICEEVRGATWEEIPSAPLLHLVDWATGDDVVGVTPDGTALTSADAGNTWQQASALPSNAVALTAAAPHDGGIEIVAVVEGALWRSTDNGGHFVRAEKRRNKIERSLIVEPANDAKYLDFIFDRETVAALGFDGGRSVFEQPAQASQS